MDFNNINFEGSDELKKDEPIDFESFEEPQKTDWIDFESSGGIVLPEISQKQKPKKPSQIIKPAIQTAKGLLYGEGLPAGLGYLQKPTEKAVDYLGQFFMTPKEEQSLMAKHSNLMAARYAAASVLLPGISEKFASPTEMKKFLKKSPEEQRFEITGLAAGYAAFGVVTKGVVPVLAKHAVRKFPWLAKPIGKIIKDSNVFRKATIRERGIIVQSTDDMVNAGLSESQILQSLRKSGNVKEFRKFKAEAIQKRMKTEVPIELIKPKVDEPIITEPLKPTVKPTTELGRKLQAAMQAEKRPPVIAGLAKRELEIKESATPTPMTTVSEETTNLASVRPLPAPMRAFGMREKPIEPTPTEPTAEIAREPVGVEKPMKEVAAEKVAKAEVKESWEMMKNELSRVPEKHGFKVVQKTITDFLPELKDSKIVKGEQRVFIVRGKKAPKTSMDESGNIVINFDTLKEGTDIVDIVLKDKATDEIRFNYALLHEIDHKIDLIRKRPLPAEGELHVSKLADNYLTATKEDKSFFPEVLAEYPDLKPVKEVAGEKVEKVIKEVAPEKIEESINKHFGESFGKLKKGFIRLYHVTPQKAIKTLKPFISKAGTTTERLEGKYVYGFDNLKDAELYIDENLNYLFDSEKEANIIVFDVPQNEIIKDTEYETGSYGIKREVSNEEIKKVLAYNDIARIKQQLVTKPLPPKPPKAKPPEAVREEIEGEVIPEPTPKVEKEKIEVTPEKIIPEIKIKELSSAQVIKKVGSSKPKDILTYYQNKYPELKGIKIGLLESTKESGLLSDEGVSKIIIGKDKKLISKESEIFLTEDALPITVRHEIEHFLDVIHSKDPKSIQPQTMGRYTHEKFPEEYLAKKVSLNAQQKKDNIEFFSGFPAHKFPKAAKGLAKLYDDHVGLPIWNYVSETLPEKAGKRFELIDRINKGIIFDYRKDPGFIEVRDDTLFKISQYNEKIKELSDAIAKFPSAEQIRIAQIIGGSITATPKRYIRAYEAIKRFQKVEKDLIELELMGEDNSFRQLTRKEIATKFKEIKAIDDKIKVLQKKLKPIIKTSKVVRQVSEDISEEIISTTTDTTTGLYETKITKFSELIEGRVKEALLQRGFAEGETTQMIARLKESVVPIEGRKGTLKEIKETVKSVVTKTIIQEIERLKTYTPSMMARARGSLVRDINKEIKKRDELLERISLHYKMSGKLYLKRAYEKIESEKGFLSKLMGYVSKRPRLIKGYDIRRKDLSYEYRKSLGEIKRAPYLVYKGLSSETHDVLMMQMFNKVAANKHWTISPQQLAIINSGKDEKLILKYKDFKPLPVTPKLGKLSGQLVDPYIWDDLNQAVASTHDIIKAWDSVLRLWKTGKVVYNPATQCRNMLSNIILADWGGLPPHRVDIYALAAKEMISKGEYWIEAKKTPLLGTEWAGAEIKQFLKDTSKLKEGNMFVRASETIKGLLDVPGKTYQGIEQFFKLAIFINERKAGRTIKQASAHAEKTIFNYLKIPPAVRWAKRWYSPFITFCVSKDTEILTDSGWKTYDKIDKSDFTLGYDVNTKELAWQSIEKINTFPYFGKMINIQSRSLDILMTPNHRNVVERNYFRGSRGNQKKIPYETIVEAQDLKPHDCIIVAGKYNDAPKEKTISDDIVRLIGWLATDGCVIPYSHAFFIDQTNKQGQKEIEAIRKRLKIDHYHTQKRQFEMGNGIHISYYIPAHIRDEVLKHVDNKKYLSVKFLRKLTKKQLKILYDTMILADGHIPKGTGANVVFTQNNNQTAHNFQILCVMLGIQCGWCKKVEEGHLSLTITTKRKRQLKRNLPISVDYDGTVWCPTTNSGTWVARRNGKIFITGNSYKAIPRFAETAIRKPWKLAKYGIMMLTVEEITRRMNGESEEEVEQEKKVLPDYMRKSVLPGQFSHLRIPYRDKYGRSKYLDLSFILPWGDVAEQWGQSHLVGRPFLPSHPFYISVAEVAFNEILFTGQELTAKDIDVGSEYWKKIGKQFWRQAMPSLAGSYSYNKLMAAYKGEVDWAMRDRSLTEAIFDTFFGLKVRSIDYTESRGRKLKYLRGRINVIKERFEKDYNKIIFNPTPDKDWDEKRTIRLFGKMNTQIDRILERITEIESESSNKTSLKSLIPGMVPWKAKKKPS